MCVCVCQNECVCVHVCENACVCVCRNVHVCVSQCAWVCVNVCIYAQTCMHACKYTCMLRHTLTHAHYAYMFMYISVYRYTPICWTYWIKNWPFTSENFSSLMSSCRFELILRGFHLNNAETQPQRGSVGFDKFCPFLTLLIDTFRDYYTPSPYLSIDESIISFKGQLSFFQYLPNKPYKWGMKAWVFRQILEMGIRRGGSCTLGRRGMKETVDWRIGWCWMKWGCRGRDML